MNLEVRATGLRAMRQKHGCQNYIPALESGARKPGPQLRQLLMRHFGCGFEELFQVVMVNPETSQEQVLTPQHGQRRPA